jgi:hypothetical protein
LHGGDLRVQADREEQRRERDRGLADHARLVRDGERVQIDDAVERVDLVLIADPVAQGAQIVSEVHLSGGLDAGQHASHGAPG